MSTKIFAVFAVVLVACSLFHVEPVTADEEEIAVVGARDLRNYLVEMSEVKLAD